MRVGPVRTTPPYSAARSRIPIRPWPASGEVTGISVVKPLPDGLTEKAIQAARQIKFRPAQKDGHVVSQYIVLEYNFNIY